MSKTGRYERETINATDQDFEKGASVNTLLIHREIFGKYVDGFFGRLTSGKWAKIGKCSTDTALNDIRDLVNKGMLKKNDEGGRSTNYSLVIEPSDNG